MDKDDKKYYSNLLKRFGYVAGGALLISLGVHSCRNIKKKNIENTVEDVENIDSLENSLNYSIKFKN